MSTINQVSNDPQVALPQEAVPSGTCCAVSSAALAVIKTLGLILMASSLACFLIGFQIPAVALLVAGAAALILGLCLKATEVADPAAAVVDQKAKIVKFVTDAQASIEDEELSIIVDHKPFIFGKTNTGSIIQPQEDWSSYIRSGIQVAGASLILHPEEIDLLYPCLTAVAVGQLRKLGGTPEQMFVNLGHYRNSEHSLRNFYKALIAYSESGNLNAPIAATRAHGMGGLDQPNTVRETFKLALDPDVHGGVQQTLQAIEDNYDSPQNKNIASCIKRVLPIVGLILQQAENN